MNWLSFNWCKKYRGTVQIQGDGSTVFSETLLIGLKILMVKTFWWNILLFWKT